MVGRYDWNGVEDVNGEWMTPAFVLFRSAVSEIG